MALIVLASAGGSPGVTTAALGLAMAWPRPVLLVEADPTGASGILAGFFRGEVMPAAGLIDLAVSQQRGSLVEDLPSVTMPIPQTSAVRLLPGIRSHVQARSLAPVWAPLAAALRDLDRTGQDVLVDAGRLGLVGSPTPLLRQGDLTLLLTRSTLPALAAARSWAAALRDDSQGYPARPGILLVGPGQPFSSREVSEALGLPVLTTLDWDPVAAEVFHRGAEPSRRFDRAALPRSLRAAVAQLQTAAAGGPAGAPPEVID